jgi:hypothetical protein
MITYALDETQHRENFNECRFLPAVETYDFDNKPTSRATTVAVCRDRNIGEDWGPWLEHTQKDDEHP